MLGKDKSKSNDFQNKRNQVENGTKIKGDLHAQGTIRVDGEIEGNLTSETKVVMGATAKLIGNLKAQTAEIAGHVSGILVVTEMLILKPSAVIEGDINAVKIMVEEGAVFNGNCKMSVPSSVVKNIGDQGEKPKAKSA